MSTPITPATSATTSSASTSGGKALTSADFMNLMITQLLHQDPLSPTDSNQLLQQIAEISSLQSNQSLQATLTGLALQQSIGAGGNLIGKLVNGIDVTGQQVTGQVIGIRIENQRVLVALHTGDELPMENITEVADISILYGQGSEESEG